MTRSPQVGEVWQLGNGTLMVSEVIDHRSIIMGKAEKRAGSYAIKGPLQTMQKGVLLKGAMIFDTEAPEK